MKEKADALVEQLNDLEPTVRLDAVRELARCDPEHAVAALHWAMLNDLDEQVRVAAKTAYETLRKAQDERSEPVESKSVRPAPQPHPTGAAATSQTKRPVTTPAAPTSVVGGRPARATAPVAEPRSQPRSPAKTGGLDTYVAKDDLLSNPRGDLSFYLGLAAAGLILLSVLLRAPFEGFASGVPILVRLLTWIGKALTLPGIALGIYGVTRKGAHMNRAVFGLVLNGLVFLLSVIILLVQRTL